MLQPRVGLNVLGERRRSLRLNERNDYWKIFIGKSFKGDRGMIGVIKSGRNVGVCFFHISLNVRHFCGSESKKRMQTKKAAVYL